MRQLYSNNAKTTLLNSIGVGSTALTVVDGTKFPNPGAYECFLVTLEVGTQIEIVRVTNRSGNTFTIAERGLEGTSPQDFAAGSRVECRVTKDTLSRMSTGLHPLNGVDLLVAPKDTMNDGFVCSSFDPVGNPAVAIYRDLYSWRFLNYTLIYSSTVVSATTSSVTAASIPVSNLASGKYLIQFTSGDLAGYVRVLTSVASPTAGWAQVLPSAPLAGVTFEILEANSSLILDSSTSGDDAIIMALLLGGN